MLTSLRELVVCLLFTHFILKRMPTQIPLSNPYPGPRLGDRAGRHWHRWSPTSHQRRRFNAFVVPMNFLSLRFRIHTKPACNARGMLSLVAMNR